MTALACYALLECDVNPQEPKLQAALKHMADYHNREGSVYSLGLRCSAWASAERSQPGKYRKLLGEEAKRLYLSGGLGRYHYQVSRGGSHKGGWDNSNSQYGVLGVWAAAQAGLEIDARYWHAVRRHWESCQNPDGGWGYKKSASTAAMVTGGVASLYVAYDAVYAGQFTRCGITKEHYPKVRRGLAWLDKNFRANLGGQNMGHSDLYY